MLGPASLLPDTSWLVPLLGILNLAPLVALLLARWAERRWSRSKTKLTIRYYIMQALVGAASFIGEGQFFCAFVATSLIGPIVATQCLMGISESIARNLAGRCSVCGHLLAGHEHETCPGCGREILGTPPRPPSAGPPPAA